MNDVQLTLIVIGLVAATRRWFPEIDGVPVAITAVVLATLAAFIAAPNDLVAAACRGAVTGLTAFGVMAAVRYTTRKLALLSTRGDAADVTLPTNGNG